MSIEALDLQRYRCRLLPFNTLALNELSHAPTPGCSARPTHIQRCVCCSVLQATVNEKMFHATHGACSSCHTAVHQCCKHCGRGTGAFVLVYFLTQH